MRETIIMHRQTVQCTCSRVTLYVTFSIAVVKFRSWLEFECHKTQLSYHMMYWKRGHRNSVIALLTIYVYHFGRRQLLHCRMRRGNPMWPASLLTAFVLLSIRLDVLSSPFRVLPASLEPSRVVLGGLVGG